MHCVICDKNLKDHELTRKHGITKEFLDICDSCLRTIPGLPIITTTEGEIVSDPFEEVEDEDDEDVAYVTDQDRLDVDSY